MESLLRRVSPILRLTRVTTAFAAVGNVWFVILWTRANPEEQATGPIVDRPAWLLLGAGALSAVALYAFGACLNDVLDARRDRALRPDRPIASGQISLDAAAVTVACTLILAVLGSTVFGPAAVLVTLVVAGAILFFNVAAKFIPAIGLVVLGLIYGGHMLVPNVGLHFLWPVWLVMTHALIVGGIAHSLARKVPPISGRAVSFAVAGWAFWSGVLLVVGWSRAASIEGLGPVRREDLAGGPWPGWLDVTVALPPAILALLFALFAWRKLRIAGAGPRAAEKIQRYGSLWLTLYATAWMLAAGHVGEAAILGSLAFAGFLGMTILRELYGLAEQPLGYRR